MQIIFWIISVCAFELFLQKKTDGAQDSNTRKEVPHDNNAR